MNQGYEALCMAGRSFCDPWHLGETASAGNAGRPTQRWQIYIAGCLGNAERSPR